MANIPDVKSWILPDGKIVFGVVNFAEQGLGQFPDLWYYGLFSMPERKCRFSFAKLETWGYGKNRFDATKKLSSAVSRRKKKLISSR